MRVQDRFIGNGNVWIGEGNTRYRGWRITCISCGGHSKAIAGHRRSSIPPDAIIKKLNQLGWEVGTGPMSDKCPECLAKVKPRAAVEPRPTQPVQPSANGKAQHVAPPIVSVPPLELGGPRFLEELRAYVVLADEWSMRNSPPRCRAYLAAVMNAIDDLRHAVVETKNAPKKLQKAITPPPTPEDDAEYRAWLKE